MLFRRTLDLINGRVGGKGGGGGPTTMFSIFTGCMMTLITSLVIVMQLCVVNQCMCVGGVICVTVGGVMCVSACVWWCNVCQCMCVVV